MKIHAIQTGTVQIKVSQRVGRGRGSMRLVNTLLDRSWTEPLPIYAWAIETAEGVIVVDTGETVRTREPGHIPGWHPYFRLAVWFDIAPEQEIGPQLRQIGIRPGDVRTVILTHLHTDHAGGCDARVRGAVRRPYLRQLRTLRDDLVRLPQPCASSPALSWPGISSPMTTSSPTNCPRAPPERSSSESSASSSIGPRRRGGGDRRKKPHPAG